jgi:hypothetical protein
MPILEVLTGDLEGRSYAIEDQIFSIGRQSDNDIVLPKKYISRRHAEIKRRKNRYVVRGLSDKNPIFHDNKEKPELVLNDGEIFEIADVRFRFRSSGTSNIAPRSKERSRQHRFESDSAPSENTDKEDTGQFQAVDDGWDDGWDDEPAQGTPKATPKAPPKQSVNFDDDFDDDDSDDTEALAREISTVRSRNPSAVRPDKGSIPSEGPGKKSVAESPAKSNEAPREQFVFGEDDGESFQDDEKTGVLNINGDDDEEQTGMLDLVDIDAPLEDPFNKGKVDNKANEKFFKTLSIIGLGAIVLAVLMVLLLDTKDPPVHRVNETPFQAALNQSVSKEIDFPAKDPPDAIMRDPETPEAIRYAAWTTIVDDAVARVDWILPSLKRRAVFLVTGKKAGQTGFVLRYKFKGDTKEFPIVVSGKSPKDAKRASRMEQLAAKGIQEIKAYIRMNLGQGDQLWSERLSRGSEPNFARALGHYRRAGEGVEILKKKISTVDSDFFALKDLVQQKIETAENGYKKFYEKQRAQYTEYRRAQRNATKEKRQVEMILRVIHNKDDPEYLRFKLFYENYYRK